MIRKILFLSLATAISVNSFAQGDAAPSSYTRPGGGFAHSDIWMQQVRVTNSFVNTYYCTLGWNPGQEAGGYCGIQDHNEGHIAIFSLWEPSNGQAITAPYVDSSAIVEPFGGEGTGMHAKANINWQMNAWNNLVLRRWPQNGHTFFGFWIHDIANSTWKHIVTMDFPMPNIYFNGNPYSFIEDWWGAGENMRKVDYRYCWVRNADNQVWKHLNTAGFSANDEARNGIYNDSFNAGTEDGGFFMQIGGNTTHAFAGHSTTLSVPSLGTDIGQTIGDFNNFQYHYQLSTKGLIASWEQDITKSPQFSYTLELFNNPNYSGAPIKTITDTIPHTTSFNLDLTNLPNQKYYLRFHTTDIFDQDSPFYTSSFDKINAPTIVITSPQDNSSFVPNSNIQIDADANDSESAVSSVEFYSNNNLLAIDSIAPYSFLWNNVYSGTYIITANATNTDGVSSVSEAVHILVKPTCNSYTDSSGSAPAYQNSTNTFDKALNGDVTTYFDYSQANNGFVQVDYGANNQLFLDQLSYYPRAGRGNRMLGGMFIASNDPAFSTGVDTLYTISSIPSNSWTTVNLTPTNGYRFYRYLSPNNDYCNIAEMSLCGDFFLNPPTSHFDCNGVLSGTAMIDSCGVCAGGNTGIIPGKSCSTTSLQKENPITPTFKIFPNPNNGNFQLEVNSQNDCIVTIKITDLQGRLVFQQEAPFKNGRNSIPVHLKIQEGVYLVSMENNGVSTQMVKMVKE